MSPSGTEGDDEDDLSDLAGQTTGAIYGAQRVRFPETEVTRGSSLRERVANLRQMVGAKTIPCPACGGGVKLQLKKGLYGWFYGCERYPTCRQTCPADQETGEPTAAPADERTRVARQRFHLEFDELWQNPIYGLTRDGAYQWLAEQLQIPTRQCHGLQFDAATCGRAGLIVREYKRWKLLQSGSVLNPVSSERARKKRRPATLPAPATLVEVRPGRRIVCLQCDGTGHLEGCPSRASLNGCTGCCPRGCPVPAARSTTTQD